MIQVSIWERDTGLTWLCGNYLGPPVSLVIPMEFSSYILKSDMRFPKLWA